MVGDGTVIRPRNGTTAVDERKTMGTAKKILMATAVTLVFFLLLEGVLAVAGVQPRRYAEDPFIGFTSHSPLFVRTTDGSGREVYTTAADKLRLFNPQTFPVKKADGTIRVFCMGGSTTFGRPFDDKTSFCGWLRRLLPEVDPSHRWEVINAGGISYASYRVALLMEELIDYEPDLFIIYSGQNEFLEARTYRGIIAMPPALRGLKALASKTRLYAALESAVAGLKPSGPAPATELGDDVVTRLDASVGPDDYERDEEQRRKIIDHFRFNLARMVDIARAGYAEAHLVVPASNLRNCSPFKSEHGEDLDEAAVERWAEEIAAARDAMTEGDTDAVLAHLEAARDTDPHDASTLFSLGGYLARSGRLEEARRAFEAARDEDVCPLRMLGEMADVVRQVAADRKAGLTDFARILDRAAADGIPGAEFFLDHVHPTIEGNGLLARSILDDLIAEGQVTVTGRWDDEVFDGVRKAVLAGVDDGDRALALMKLSKVLGWAGKLQEAYRSAWQAVRLAPGDSAVLYQAGLSAQLIGRTDQAIAAYRRAIEVQPDAELPHQNLGVILQPGGDIDGAIEQFRKAQEYARSEATTRDNRLNLGEALAFKGILLYRQRRFDEAITCLEESDRLIPGTATTLSALGQAQLAIGLPGEAAVSFQRAAESAPDDAGIRNLLAVAYGSAGRIEEARAAWKRALELDSSLGDSPRAAPRVLEAAGRHDAARFLLAGGE